jgi:Icc-related predicted phosphoesterase
MKVACISDTHNQAKDLVLPDADVLVHAGDFTSRGHRKEFDAFASWLSQLPHKNIIVVAGNHDFFAEKFPLETKALFEGVRTGIHYLHDESVEIDGMMFYGSPYQPEFHDWAFNLHRGPLLKEKWALIPDDADVVITHGPPVCIGDQVAIEGTLALESVGCVDLARRLQKLSKLKLHVSGHIHEGYGLRTISGVKYVNASVLDRNYRLRNTPIVVDI